MSTHPFLKHREGYIGGSWTAGDKGPPLPVVNPATGEVLAELNRMGKADTIRAVEAAEAALSSPASLDQRRAWLEAIARALLDNQDEIGTLITLENGKPLAEGRGEVAYAAGFFRNAAEHIDVLAPRTLPGRPKGCAWTVHYRPGGVAGLITPWNFPIGMIAKKLAAAIAADTPAVVKPAKATPLSMIALFQILDETVRLPPGRANLVIGNAGAIGGALMEHPAVRIISFTGSTEIGRTLMEQAAPQIKRLALELGGNAPFIVFPDADLDAAAEQLMATKFRAGGQTCVCANRIFVHRSVADAFCNSVASKVNALTVGNGMDDGVDIGPLIDRQGFDKVKRHVEAAMEAGAVRIAGRDPDPPAGENWGCFFPPTVLRGVRQDMTCCREETFGPVVPILEFNDEEEVLDAANAVDAGLAAYFFTADASRAERVAAALRFGHIGWNTGTGPTPEAPFGGMKHSGFGREGGIEGLTEFAEIQTVAHGGE